MDADREKLGGIEERETIIRIYNMWGKTIFNKRKKDKIVTIISKIGKPICTK